ncbi:hypothetical protein T484DRAFT_1757477 [Baffinella frigidus]|nr:hypothetical protein T484DRAFT_1757477 [Cryptophyta sp. CCMP2293]
MWDRHHCSDAAHITALRTTAVNREDAGLEMVRVERAFTNFLGGIPPWVAYGIKIPQKQWVVDRTRYERGAPSQMYLDDIGWYERTEDSQRLAVYNAFHMACRFVEMTYQKGNWYKSEDETDALCERVKREGAVLYAVTYNQDMLRMMPEYKRGEALSKCEDSFAQCVYAAAVDEYQWGRDRCAYMHFQQHPQWPAKNEGFHFWDLKDQREHVYSSRVQAFLWERLVLGCSGAVPAVLAHTQGALVVT